MNLCSIRLNYSIHCRAGKMIMGVVLAAVFLMTLGTAQAYTTYEGGDWGGMDFMPANGDILSGIFTNIGHFIVNSGDTIYAGSGLLSLFTNDALIKGTLYGGSDLSPILSLTSQSNITMTSTGILDQWESIYLASMGGTISLSGTINALNGGSVSLNDVFLINGNLFLQGGGTLSMNSSGISREIVISPGAAQLVTGGSIEITPVPVPSAVFLFGSGLAAIRFVRRRSTM